MQGQYSMFDTDKPTRPCDYRFRRYIGQVVRRWRTGKISRITEIKPYYTYLEDGTVATPYDISPVDAEDIAWSRL